MFVFQSQPISIEGSNITLPEPEEPCSAAMSGDKIQGRPIEQKNPLRTSIIERIAFSKYF